MKSLLRLFSAALVVGLLSASASAHPGHGEPGPAHYITSVDHVAVIVLASTLVLSCVWVWNRSRTVRRQDHV